MPRARSQVEVIIEQLATIRAHILTLNQTLADQVSLYYHLFPAVTRLMII
jgi:nitrate reductase assembly molybdenum cofactor insertion protein NarJ